MEQSELVLARQAKRREIAMRSEEEYWTCWAFNIGVPPIMMKDYILSIAPQTGMPLTDRMRQARQESRAVIEKTQTLNKAVTDALTVEAVNLVSWDAPV